MSIDWRDKIKPLRINTNGKHVPQYLKPIPELIDEFGMFFFPTARHAADGWVQVFATIEGGVVPTASQVADIVFKEAATHLASHHLGLITDLISRRQVEEALRRTKAVCSHFGSSAAPSLSGQRGACELIAEDFPQAATPPPFALHLFVRTSFCICTKQLVYQSSV